MIKYIFFERCSDGTSEPPREIPSNERYFEFKLPTKLKSDSPTGCYFRDHWCEVKLREAFKDPSVKEWIKVFEHDGDTYYYRILKIERE